MLEFIKEKKIIICIIIVAIILIGKNIYDNTQNFSSIGENQAIVNNTTNDEEQSEKNEEDGEIAVHITGAVKNAGVVKVKENSRIEDAIKAAGGLSDDADITNVNLAFQLEDGVKIKIPSVNDKEKEAIITDGSGIDEDSEIDVDTKKDTSSNSKNTGKSSGKVNINKASQSELETLNGVGPALASKIVEYREANGKFKSIDDLKNVTGIGDKKFESIKDNVEI